jgi:uncharacterized protein (TIGR03086 family)
MDLDIFGSYDRASAWAVGKVPGAATQLDAPTPCEEWDVRALLNHTLQVQRYFCDKAEGKDAELTPEPLDVIGDDPVGRFEKVRIDMLRVFGDEAVRERSGPMLGIALADLLVHGWDLARASGQDETMPAGLADAAYRTIHGQLSPEQRAGLFGPELDAGPDPSEQARLLAYTGRDPAG